MTERGKTSTFTIRHDRCDPASWTANDILAFDRFVRFGDLQHAARLSRLGVQLVMSEHHEPKGGTLQQVGWVSADSLGIDECTDDLGDLVEDDVQAVMPVYVGPAQYAVRIPMGDRDGNFEGYEYELKPSETEAEAYAESLYEEAGAP